MLYRCPQERVKVKLMAKWIRGDVDIEDFCEDDQTQENPKEIPEDFSKERDRKKSKSKRVLKDKWFEPEED